MSDSENVPSDPIQQSVAQARGAAADGDFAAAIAAQAQAVALLRERLDAAGEPQAGLVQLSVLLYNLAGYLGRAGRFDDAVSAMEEVVGLDERTGHEDLATDREVLVGVRALAEAGEAEQQAWLEAQAARTRGARTRGAQGAGGPEAGGVQSAETGAGAGSRAAMERMIRLPSSVLLANSYAQVARMPEGDRAAAEAGLREFAARWDAMDADGRRALLKEMAAVQQTADTGSQLAQLVDQARNGAIAALRGEINPADYKVQTEALAEQVARGQAPGSPGDALAAYLRALVALVQGEPVPPVAEPYAAHVAAVQAATREREE